MLTKQVAVLEEIAASTKQALVEIRSEIRGLRSEIQAELREFRSEMRADIRALQLETQTGLRDLRNQRDADFRWLVRLILGGFGLTLAGFAGLLGVMAHGFHWL
jgi:hypothetical protein